MNTNPLFTNVVLVIIAALLLVLVIQNGMRPTPMARPMLSSPHSTAMAPAGDERNPTVNNAAPNMGGNMFFLAIKAFPEGCQSAKVLNDCDSPAAKVVKSKIESLVAEGRGPRQVFDYVVETWGEKALTDQALQIRNMRVKGK